MTGGRWLVEGDGELFEACAPRLEEALRKGSSGRERIRLGGRAGVHKYGPLWGKARWRHALRLHLLRASLPRLREFENLTWLRRHGYGAPKPLFAAAFLRHGLPLFQALVTEEVPDATTLRQLLEAGPSPVRTPAVEELGRLVAGLHAQGFVHRDLFPRNLLVTHGEDGPRLHFLDAWRGGPRRGLRGPTYDIACLLLYAPSLLERDEEALLLATYFDARAQEGAPLDREHLLARAARMRRRLVLHLERRGRHSPPIPARDWAPPPLER